MRAAHKVQFSSIFSGAASPSMGGELYGGPPSALHSEGGCRRWAEIGAASHAMRTGKRMCGCGDTVVKSLLGGLEALGLEVPLKVENTLAERAELLEERGRQVCKAVSR
jgi:hypothetical protein